MLPSVLDVSNIHPLPYAAAGPVSLVELGELSGEAVSLYSCVLFLACCFCVLHTSVMEEVLSETEWNKEAVIKLIDLYRENHVLWDQTCAEFKDRNAKNNAWTEISLAMKITKSEVQSKMKKLIGQFQRECKLKSGSGADSVKSKWFAFDSLQFIKDKAAPRQTREAGLHNLNEVSKNIHNL